MLRLLLEPRHLNFGKNVYIPFFSVLTLDINYKNLSQSTQTQVVVRPPILVSLSACVLALFVHYGILWAKDTFIGHNWLTF